MNRDMSNPFAAKDAVIAELVGRVEREVDAAQRDEVRRFMEVFYLHAAPDDLVSQPLETLFAIALHMWRLGRARKTGEPRIEVFNPRALKKDAWPTPHTAIAIVTDDMPFLVDSLSGGLAAMHHYRIHAVYHPIVIVERDARGKRRQVVGAVDFERADEKGQVRESYMYFEIDAQSDPAVLERIENLVRSILRDVRRAVGDWRPMMAKIDETVASLTINPPPIDEDAFNETVRFLRWLGNDRFTFLGYREYRFEGDPASSDFSAVEDSGLGILRDPKRYILRGKTGLAAISAEIRHFLTIPHQPVIITKANVKSTVHRPVHMDYVGVKIYDADGRVIGERRFVGLFTSQAYADSCYETPLLRRKVEAVQRRALFDRRSHAGKVLRHILETFPRDELFQIDEDRLLRTALGILHLLERPRPRAFIRRDKFERFVSALVYVPRDVYQSGLREAVARILCDAFNGEVSVYYAQLSEEVLARWHFIIRTRPGEVPPVDEAAIDRAIAEAAKGWPERLREHLIDALGEERGLRLFERYGHVFSISYQEDFEPRFALRDISKLEELEDSDRTGFELYRRKGDDPATVRLKLYSTSHIIPLSECLPKLEHLGLKVISEHAYELAHEAGGCIHDFLLVRRGGGRIDLEQSKARLERLLADIWAGVVEDDRFNGLGIAAGMDSREIVILRAYGRFMRQLGLPFGQTYIAECLLLNARIAVHLVTLFKLRFDPDFDESRRNRGKRIAALERELKSELDAVASIDQDRILRAFINLITATARTNYYQDPVAADDGIACGLAFKIRSREVEEAPAPKPWREIFVYSPRVEGVHLRWGPVARGGLRWSDRRQDFRTEVLGLVKAQQVKNAVIVPVGAKGGFVPRRLPPADNREAVLAEGIACYKCFVASLLSLTDNLVDGELVPPSRVVRHDRDDPYLVVAADKGTATFSDIANEIALKRNFWLGDAFASGGSHGYDHKAMGITARGAWVSVQRHFREMGIDVQREPVRVIGVGDMSGDVFGNGMLLSRTIKLVAAFDHRHIFVDPDPDPKKSHAERRRLFRKPRSSWADYRGELISKGGGVWPRTLKAIPLSPEMKALLGVEEDRLSPNRLIHEILKAEADLLWFGGIGTYVKASDESHVEAGDRTNDAVRIDASELRVKVVGEGANLGMTQRGRIEFARHGGRLNTDFIDNSAGVDTSDKEVNLKILLADAIRKGKLDMEARDRLLAEMTDEVASIVLSNNYLQTQAISTAEAQAVAARESHAGLIRTLEREGTLDREIEHLPSDEDFSELALNQRGLTRPELAVLMAYAKLSLKAVLLNSGELDNPILRPELEWSFPVPVRERFAEALGSHRLRRELIATVLVNEIVNRAGITFVYEVREETGLGVDQIATAFLLARDVFRLGSLWPAIDALDYKVPATIQMLMHLEIAEFLKHQVIWFLRNEERPFDLAALISSYGDGVGVLLARPEAVLSPIAFDTFRTKLGMYVEQGVPKPLARKLAALPALDFACDIEKVANTLAQDVADVGRAYFEVGHRLGFDWLRQTSELVVAEDHWDRLAARAVLDELDDQQRELCRHILTEYPDLKGSKAVDAWVASEELTMIRADRLMADLRSSGPMSVAKLSFAARHMHSILSRAGVI
ncbi:MAG: NAD-glutamate dehydrogenase [Rhodothalassiaceae bacterium]